MSEKDINPKSEKERNLPIGIGDVAFSFASSVVLARIFTGSFTSARFWAFTSIGQAVGLATEIWTKRYLDKRHREGKHTGFPARD